jgi:hypothetical protein
MTSLDWTASGIENTFRFEAVDCRQLENHICDLEGVTGGKLTQSYRGDYRASGTLDLDGTEVPDHCAVRIWHTARLGAASVTECLATLIPQPPSRTLERGRVTGSVELYSAMKSLDGDLLTANSTIAKGTAAWSKFKSIVNNSGQVAVVDSGIQSTNKTLGSAWTWEHGKSALSAAQKMADVCGGYIEVDAQGHVCLVPYENPASRATGGTISTGIDSLVLLGVSMSQNDICNKVVASFDKGSGDSKKTYTAAAELDPVHPWSFANIGRWCAQECDAPSTLDDKSSESYIKAQLAAAVKKELNSASATTRTFGVTMLYTPEVDVGNAMRLRYQDSDGGEVIDANVFISQREITLDGSMQMELTCEERWANAADTLAEE